MNRTKLNYWIDIGLALSFLTCFITGLIKWHGLIRIIGTSAYKTLHFTNISLIHDWSGLIMGVLVLIHLGLHWKWIVAVTKSIFKRGEKGCKSKSKAWNKNSKDFRNLLKKRRKAKECLVGCGNNFLFSFMQA